MNRQFRSRRPSARSESNSRKGEQIEFIDSRTGEIDLATMPDEIRFEVDAVQQERRHGWPSIG